MPDTMTLLLGFDLLDRQIVDFTGALIGKVDDLELTVDEQGNPHVSALLVGPQALGRRMGGRLGRWISGVAGRLHPAENPDPLRIGWDLVANNPRTDCVVKLSVRRELFTEPALEQWLRTHVIDRIPGGDHAGG
jgi:sporulation protein YlmC with PRC-barrel domain